MTAARLTPRDRRALLFGLLVLVPALTFSVGVRPFLDRVGSVQEQLLVHRDLLQRESALLADVGRYPARLEVVTGAMHAQLPRLFGGTDGVTATAALAGYVDHAARASRLLVQGSDSRAAEVVAPGVLELGVSIRAVGDLEGVLSLLHSLEEGARLVRVEGLNIERMQRFGADGSVEEAPLLLSAVLVGYAVLPLAMLPAPSVGSVALGAP